MTPSSQSATLSMANPTIAVEALRRAAVRATLAPSVHNTQPWQLVIGRGTLEIHADFSRQLQVLDPTRRQLIISCGCAVLNARVSLAADGYPATVRWPADPGRPDLLAELSSCPDGDLSLAMLDPVLTLRRTNRREFFDDAVPSQLIEVLIEAADREGGQLVMIDEPAHRRATALLSQRADAIENADPRYRAELRAWVTEDPRRTDGVAFATVPNGRGPAGDRVPLRGHGAHEHGGLPEHTRSSSDQCLLLLGSDSDDPLSWLRAGQALERVWLEVTRAGYVMSLFTQVIEVPATRQLLRSELGLSMQPHVLLRVGRAPATPFTRRRKLVDVLRQHPRGSLIPDRRLTATGLLALTASELPGGR
ncbi:MAG: nitroreductase [Jatrophihabitantaceae bacterium]